MKKGKKGRIAKVNPNDMIKLEKSFTSNDLIEVKTGNEYKKETVLALKSNLHDWMQNPNFDQLREVEIDLAIIAYVNSRKMKTQDVDNISKTILDALQEKRWEGHPFLIKNDSQVRRLLLEKREKLDDANYDTDMIFISFREYDPMKQMILTRQ